MIMDLITPSQCRAARGLLNWSQPELAKKCGMHVQTISAFEHETGTPTKTTLEKIRIALKNAGVVFTEQGGVNPNISDVVTYEGQEGFRLLMDDVYKQAKERGGKIRLWNGRPDYFIEWLGEEWYEKHTKRMQKIRDDFSFHITCKEGDTNFIGNKHAEYRWVPKKIFNEQSIYCYGEKIAFLKFKKDSVKIFILHSKDIYDSFCLLFDSVWDDITTIPNVAGYKPTEKIEKKKA